MTKYLLRKILSQYKNEVIASKVPLKLLGATTIDVKQIIHTLYEDSSKQAVCIKQLETLTTSYQVYRKQELYQEAIQLELKILYILGIQVHG